MGVGQKYKADSQEFSVLSGLPGLCTVTNENSETHKLEALSWPAWFGSASARAESTFSVLEIPFCLALMTSDIAKSSL